MSFVDEKQRLARQQAGSSPHPADPTNVDDPTAAEGLMVPDIEAPDDAPPAYGEHIDQVEFSQPGFQVAASVAGDGRVNININTKNRRLADLLAPTIQDQASADSQPPLPPAYIPPSLGGQPGQTPPPHLNVVIQIVGSRGDVQPFVALGKVLKDTYGHRVRIATHPVFRNFVEENGLEFFSIGGDPAELMAFMVKHPGLMPGFDAIKSGEITKRRKGIADMLVGCWRSCIEAGDGTGPAPTPHRKDAPLDTSANMPGDQNLEPFVADVIVANPPSFAHVHVAEKLGIPLHMMFTMPWSPTRAFPHPLANIQSSNADDVMTNYLTYTLVEMMTWQGLGDVINRFREKALDLAPLSLIWAPGLIARLKLPYTYCWSPALIPKPNDWGQHIDISGFFFLNLASAYTPEPELAAFLENGPPPVYIGFGSIVVDDPDAMTRMIFDAIHTSGVRALVSKGWGGLGADDVGVPEGVYMLGNVPHDWLFQHVSAVVHHGGAGTTAAGIQAGKPTLVVPFFGDQPFWGAMIAKAHAGPDPIPYKQLNAEKLAEAIQFCLRPETLERAKELGARIREEKGTDVGGQSLHSHLDIDSMRCSVAPSRTAVWRVRKSEVRLSPLAAAVLVDNGLVKYSDLKLYRSKEYNTEDQPPDPISAAACSLVTDLSDIGLAIADIPRSGFKSWKNYKDNQGSQASSSPQVSRESTNTLSQTASKTQSGTDLASPEETGSSRDALGSPPTTQSQTNRSQQSLPSASSSAAASMRASTAGKKPDYRDASPSSPADVGFETVVDTGKSVGRIVTTGVKSPMNFCLGLAKGFRNVPRLYNDDTVRPIEKVTGFSSGVRVASKEFGYGLLDGVSGFFSQPVKGLEKEGASGFLKGFGKGLGGIVMKPAAGAWAIPAYTMQGVYAEVNKFFTRSVHNYIMTSRITQGERDFAKASIEERHDIVARWKSVNSDLKGYYRMKKEQKVSDKARADNEPLQRTDSGSGPPETGFSRTRNLTFDQRKELHAQKDAYKKGYFQSQAPGSSSSSGGPMSNSEDAEFEEAIKASVRETSRGNPREDAVIEAAIRQSVGAIRQGNGLPDPVRNLPEKDPRSLNDPSIFNDEEYKITDEEYQALIEQTIQQSLGGDQNQMQGSGSRGVAQSEEPSSSQQRQGNEGADLQRAITESRNAPDLPPRQRTGELAGLPGDQDHPDEGAELQRAMDASKDHYEREKSVRTEEETVMEYVRKQSLAEEEYRKQATKGKVSGAHKVDEDDDDELKRAMEESLKMSHGGDGGPSEAGGS